MSTPFASVKKTMYTELDISNTCDIQTLRFALTKKIKESDETFWKNLNLFLEQELDYKKKYKIKGDEGILYRCEKMIEPFLNRKTPRNYLPNVDSSKFIKGKNFDNEAFNLAFDEARKSAFPTKPSKTLSTLSNCNLKHITVYNGVFIPKKSSSSLHSFSNGFEEDEDEILRPAYCSNEKLAGVTNIDKAKDIMHESFIEKMALQQRDSKKLLMENLNRFPERLRKSVLEDKVEELDLSHMNY